MLCRKSSAGMSIGMRRCPSPASKLLMVNNPDMPRKPEEIRRATATYHASSCEVKTDGARLGGLLSGSRDGNLLRASSAHGLQGHEPDAHGGDCEDRGAVCRLHLPWRPEGFQHERTWKGSPGAIQEVTPRSMSLAARPTSSEVPVVVKNRVLIGEGKSGSIATFPPPHQFFFPRQIEVNLGYVWYRKDNDSSFAFGVRQSETAGNYNYPIQNAGNSNASWSQGLAALQRAAWNMAANGCLFLH